MIEISQLKVTLIGQRDGKERFTRYPLKDVINMITTGKLKSGKEFAGQSDCPSVVSPNDSLPSAP